jgi:DNA-binding LacI/PurR family transcriptional regulator
MAGRVTIADVAGRLGISKASVSYALNDQPGVSPETRRRVREAARELGWYPSSSARALSRARTGAIGIVLSRDPDTIGTEPYYMRVMSGIESVLIDADMELMLRMVGLDHGRDLRVYERWAGEGRVDGVILFDQREDDPRLPLVRRLAMPAVLTGGPDLVASVPSVSSNERADAAHVVDHLRELGHEHVLHVTGPMVFMHERRRRQAVRESAAELGMVVETVEGDYTLEGAGRVVALRLADPHPPTAIIFGNDVMAMGGLVAAAASGVEVPRQLSLVSWEDSMLCHLASPQVTALDRDPSEYGRLSATMLLAVISGADPPNIVTAPSVLRVRASSAPALVPPRSA